MHYICNEIRPKMPTIISIPEVNRDDRIGSVFNVLFNIINRCENSPEIIFDFSGRTFFHPFFIAALGVYCDCSEKQFQFQNIGPNLKAYMDTITFSNPKILAKASDVDDLLRRYREKSYTPICKFPTQSAERDDIETRIQHLIEIQSNATGSAKFPLSYMFSELITNIVEHSQSEYGYIYSQYLTNEGCVDICIADKGISIFGSYVKAGKYDIQSNPAEALRLAVMGHSTKNLPFAENRGYGISTSIKMLVDGLHGSFFILSGGAFYRHDKNGANIVRLPESLEWNGTIVLLRIPLSNIPADFDGYKYVE